MVRIAVSGALGQMGGAVLAQAATDPEMTIVAGIDPKPADNLPYPLVADIADLSQPIDVLVDFSRPSVLPALLGYANAHGTALVLGTTGYTDDDRRRISETARQCAVFMAPNMSFGVAVLADLVRRATAALVPGFDVEICETHHRRKVDAPSGTALMLADAVAGASTEPMTIMLDRHGAREAHEIGVVALRGGTVAGQHTVGFYGEDEVIELRHTAQSRRALASGALRAVKFVAQKAPGLYTMEQLIAS